MISLVTGGARSGKSSFAESLLEGKEDVVYIATSRVYDVEMEERINLHKKSRPEIWRTFEGNYDLEEAVEDEKFYILDCITVLTSNIMFDISKDNEYIDYKMQNEIEDTIMNSLMGLINKAKKMDLELVLVTNEVGSSIVPEHHISRVFRDIQGRINQKLGQVVDSVYFVTCGIPVKIK